MPLLCLVLIIAYNNLNWQLMSYVNLKMEMRLECVYRTGIARKRAALEYRHVENNDTWELINRVGSLLVILMAQVWWAGLAIVAISVPLFRLAIKSGQQMYEKNKQTAGKRSWTACAIWQGLRQLLSRRAMKPCFPGNLAALTCPAASGSAWQSPGDFSGAMT
jgi:hypothetical protein